LCACNADATGGAEMRPLEAALPASGSACDAAHGDGIDAPLLADAPWQGTRHSAAAVGWRVLPHKEAEGERWRLTRPGSAQGCEAGEERAESAEHGKEPGYAPLVRTLRDETRVPRPVADTHDGGGGNETRVPRHVADTHDGGGGNACSTRGGECAFALTDGGGGWAEAFGGSEGEGDGEEAMAADCAAGERGGSMRHVAPRARVSQVPHDDAAAARARAAAAAVQLRLLRQHAAELQCACLALVPASTFAELYAFFCARASEGDAETDAHVSARAFDRPATPAAGGAAEQDALVSFVYDRISLDKSEVVTKIFQLLYLEEELRELELVATFGNAPLLEPAPAVPPSLHVPVAHCA